MLGYKSQAQAKPTALGTMMQAATYGLAIPRIYGTTRSALLAIWACCLRQGSSSKKGKKKGVQTYAENIDFLIGANPIECALQFWNNNTRYGLDFKVYRVAPGAALSVTIPDTNYYKLIGVTAEVSLVSPITFNDYGSPGPVTYGGGTSPTIAASIIAKSPQVIPVSQFYYGPNPTLSPAIITIMQAPAGRWVVARVRQAGVSIWDTETDTNPLIPGQIIRANAQCAVCQGCDQVGWVWGPCLDIRSGVPCAYEAGPYDPSTRLCAGTQIDYGNILASGSFSVPYDGETCSFNISGDPPLDSSTSTTWTLASNLGPLTFGAVTFPGADVAQLTPTTGHNLTPAVGGTLWIGKYKAQQSGGADLYVAIVTGAATVGAKFAYVPGWTCVMPGIWSGSPGLAVGGHGTYIWVFVNYAVPTGTVGMPLWNANQHGPNLIDPNYVRQSNYKWNSNTDGATIEILDPQSANPPGFPLWSWNGFLDFWYAARNLSTKLAVPASLLNLIFEPQLGNGTEYIPPYQTQQIIYPEFAGMESSALDLGAAGVIPSIRGEFKGTFAKIPPRGDAEFPDMIEDIITSGQVQLGAALGLIQHGVNANELPGPVQKNFLQYSPDAAINLPFRTAITAGDILVAFCRTSAATPSISDTAGQTWNVQYNSGNKGIWYTNTGAIAAPAGDVVSFGSAAEAYILELDPGSTAIDNHNVATGSGTGPASSSIQVFTTDGPTYILGILIDDSGSWGPLPYQWNHPLFSRAQTAKAVAFYRIVNATGTYSVSIPRSGSGNWALALFAFKRSQPVPYPKALGAILDQASLNTVRAQCLANSLWGSYSMDAQRKAADVLQDLYDCANADPVWSGFTLKSIARSEVSTVANGAIYTAPTSGGPVWNFTESTLKAKKKQPLVRVVRKKQVDAINILKAQIFDRNADYNQSNVLENLPGAATMFGPREDSPRILPMVVDPLVGRKILGIAARRHSLLRNKYLFTGHASSLLLEPGDLVTVPDSKISTSAFAVRLTKMAEADDASFDFEGDPYIYGCNAPGDLPASSPAANSQSSGQTGADPGSVNTPIIFEPPPRLFTQQNQTEIWFVVSGSSANYGGCVVLVSVDGGSSYAATPLGQCNGNAVTGYIAADWAAHADPDQANDLYVNVSESLGVINALTTQQEDGFVLPCYVAGGLSCIPYELMTYAGVLSLGNYNYQLVATLSGEHLRRAVFSCPQPAQGVLHNGGSRFALLDPAGTGILKVPMDPSWIGKTIFFKFLAFNKQNNVVQQQSAATAYSYAPTGCPATQQNPNTNTYSITGGALTQPTPTSIHMAQATAQFPSNLAQYNARTFTISAPGAPTTYYVTIQDPAELGDQGTQTNLTAFCETSNAKVGAAGYVYIGSIVALPAGGGTVTGPGGSIPGGGNPDEILINGT